MERNGKNVRSTPLQG